MRALATLLLLLATSASATAAMPAADGQADYCVRLGVYVENELPLRFQTALCRVRQGLSMGDITSIWRCRFGDSAEVETLLADASRFGYSAPFGEPFVEYDLEESTRVGQFLFKNLGIDLVKAGDVFDIRFLSGAPRTDHPIIRLLTERQQLELRIEGLSYAPCERL